MRDFTFFFFNLFKLRYVTQDNEFHTIISCLNNNLFSLLLIELAVTAKQKANLPANLVKEIAKKEGSAMKMKKAAMKLKKESAMMLKKSAMEMKKASAMKMKMKAKKKQ